MISVKIIDTQTELLKLREQWDSLVDDEHLDISNSYDWSMCLLESHLDKKHISTIVIEDDARPLAIFPFFARQKSLNLIPVRTLCPLFHLHSVHNDLLLRRNRVEVFDFMFDALKHAKELCNWHLMEIPALVAGGATDTILRSYLDAQHYNYKIFKGASSPFLTIANRSWEEYLASKPSKLRNNFKRVQKNIENAGTLDIQRIMDPGEILAILYAIENRSWKYQDKSAITCKPEQMIFYRLLINRLQRHIVFFVLSLDQVPVSYTLCLLFRNKCYFLKTSYDETYKKLSPGIALLLYLLKYAFEHNMSEFDFAGENEGHKLALTADIRHHNDYMIFNKHPYSALLYKLGQVRSFYQMPDQFCTPTDPDSADL
jgi:hypothetical protein